MIKINTNFDNTVEYVRESKMSPNDNLRVIFMMTGECNFRCSYCYEFKRPDVLDVNLAKHFIDMLFDIDEHDEYWNGFFNLQKKKDNITFDFFGGECLLEIDNIETLCSYFIELCNKDLEKYQKRKDNFKIVIETNGSLLQTPKVVAFLNKWCNNFESLFVTVDGSQKSHDACRIFKDTHKPTWEIVKNNILWLRKEYPDVVISTKGTIVPSNVKYLYESFLEYQRLGFKSIKTTLGIGIPWDDESLKILKEQYQLIVDDLLANHLNDDITFFTFNYKYFDNRLIYNEITHLGCGTCGTDGSQLALTPRNEICLCHAFSYLTQSDENAKSLVLGNLSDGITNDGMKVNEMVRNYYPEYKLSQKCTQCSCRALCDTCSASEVMHGSGLEGGPDCRAKKIESNMRYIYNFKRDLLCQQQTIDNH